jgi:hypothetical protein
MQDIDIRRMYVVEGWSVDNISNMTGFNRDSVRGRIHRTDLAGRVALCKELAEAQPLVNKWVERQSEIVRRGEDRFRQHQEKIAARGGMATGVFASDFHLPYLRWPAFLLTLFIIEDIQPDYYSAFNDLFDFEGYGRWPDTRPLAARLWSEDIWNALRLSRELHGALTKAAPDMLKVQLMGNHDNWMYHHIRTGQFTGYSEQNIYLFMHEIASQGVVQFSNGENKKENIIQLSPGLKWVHGVSASSNIRTVAAATQNMCRGREETGDEGIFYYTVSGHTHRDGEVSMNGVRHWNSGTLRELDAPYLKHTPLWDTSIVINRFDPNSRYVEGEIVRYRVRGGHLVARYNGVDYDVPLKD